LQMWIHRHNGTLLVGGCGDTPVDLVAGGNNVDGKRPCLGNGKTVLTRTPTQTEFVECWSEVIIRNGLPPALVDDLLFLQTILSEGHGCGCQEGYLISDGGFF
jgi:hypothetical protein